MIKISPKYIVIITLIILLIGTKYIISPAPTEKSASYIAVMNWSDVLLKNCQSNKTLCSRMPFQQGRANWMRLQTVQYIGEDVYANYYPELYDRLQDVTTLDSYRNSPYIFGQYLLPDTLDENNTGSRQQAIALGKKGLEATCDSEQIKKVAALSDTQFIDIYYHKDRQLMPCKSYLLPQAVGFVLFQYAKDIPQAIIYYRVAALAPDAPDMLVDMPAILVGRYDTDTKSMMMRYQRFRTAQDQLNPELNDKDLLFIISLMEHTIRKAVHHTFLAIMHDTAAQYKCDTSMLCVQKHLATSIQQVLTQCESGDSIPKTSCLLIQYAQGQGRLTNKGKMIYPLDPQHMTYGRRPDLEKWDLVEK